MLPKLKHSNRTRLCFNSVNFLHITESLKRTQLPVAVKFDDSHGSSHAVERM
jgi:hypothetical protein